MTAYDDSLNAPRVFVEAMETEIATLKAALGAGAAQQAADLAQAEAALAARTADLAQAQADLAARTIERDAERSRADNAESLVVDLQTEVDTLQTQLVDAQTYGVEQQQAAQSWQDAWQTQVDAFNEHMLTVHGTPDPGTPPPVPTGLVAVAGDEQVDLAWDAVTAESCRVYQAPTASGPWTLAADEVTTPARTVASLNNGTAYWFAVTAVDAAGLESDRSTAATATPVEPAPSGARWPGDAGVGKLLIGNNGSNTGADMSAADFDVMAFGSNPTKRHSLVRLYNGDDMLVGSGMKSQINSFTNQGRTVMLSFSSGSRSLSQVAAGVADDDLRTIGAYFASLSAPIMVTFVHEPDNPSKASGQQPDTYRAAYRRAVTIINTVPGATAKVCWNAGWIMEFGYRSRDYRLWHPNWSGTGWLHDGPFDVPCSDGTVWHGSWVHLDAIDLYNPQTGPGASARNATWQQSITRGFLPKRQQRNQPPLFFTIGEAGWYSDLGTLDDNGVTVAEILQDMATSGVDQGLVAVAAWSNDRSEYNTANDPTGSRRQAWRDMVAHNPHLVTRP